MKYKLKANVGIIVSYAHEPGAKNAPVLIDGAGDGSLSVDAKTYLVVGGKTFVPVEEMTEAKKIIFTNGKKEQFAFQTISGDNSSLVLSLVEYADKQAKNCPTLIRKSARSKARSSLPITVCSD